MSTPSLMIFTGNANPELAHAIAGHLGVPMGKANVGRFSDGEVMVEIVENVRARDIFVIQPTCQPAAENFMELLVMVDALKRASAGRVTAILPYFGYARQDRRPRSSRVPITAKVAAKMIGVVGTDRVVTVDLHADQIQGFFDIPVDNLYASPIFALDIKTQFKDAVQDVMIVSPDVGGVARARELAKRINAPLSIVDKRREIAGEVAEMTVIGDVTDKICIIVDDMCDTAGTMCKAAQVLLDCGAREVHAYTTHGVMSGPAVERVTNSVLKSMVITDTIEATEAVRNTPNIRIIPTAPVFAQAILNIWNGTSVSSLFETPTLEPVYEGQFGR